MVLWLFFVALTGIWFGAIQGGVWLFYVFILGPAFAATITFGVVYPLANRIIAWRIQR